MWSPSLTFQKNGSHQPLSVLLLLQPILLTLPNLNHHQPILLTMQHLHHQQILLTLPILLTMQHLHHQQILLTSICEANYLFLNVYFFVLYVLCLF